MLIILLDWGGGRIHGTRQHVEVITNQLGRKEVSIVNTPSLPFSQYKPEPNKINEVLISSEQPENKGKAVGKVFFVNQNFSSYAAWQPVLPSGDIYGIQSLNTHITRDSDDNSFYIALLDHKGLSGSQSLYEQRYETIKTKMPQITYRGYMLNVGGKSGDITLTAHLDKNLVDGRITNRIVNPVQEHRDLLLKEGKIYADMFGIYFRGESIIPAGSTSPLDPASFEGVFVGKNMEEVVGRISGLPNEVDSVFGGTQVTK